MGPGRRHVRRALTKDHGALLADNTRLEEELAAERQQTVRLGEDLGKAVRESEERGLALECAKRARATAEAAQRAAGQRHAEVERDFGTVKAEIAAARSKWTPPAGASQPSSAPTPMRPPWRTGTTVSDR
jgi:hypothetical protein